MVHFRRFAIGTLLSALGTIHGAVIFSNFGAGDSYNSSSGWIVGSIAGSEFRVAMPFQTSSPMFLTSIRFGGNLVTGPNDFTISIASDSGGSPGAAVETFAGATFPAPLSAIQTITSVANPLLQGNQTYWLVMQATSSSSATHGGWAVNDQGQIGAYLSNSNNGFIWGLQNDEASISPVFEINGIPSRGGPEVPEPSSLALIVGGCGVV